MTEATLTLLAAAIGGGMVGEILRYIRARRSSQPGGTESRASTLAEFEALRAAYIVEIQRLNDHLRDLEHTILLLSSEILKLGGDPFAIRAALLRSDITRQPEERKNE